MTSFSIANYSYHSVTVKVTGISSGDTVRIFVRLSSDSGNETADKSYTATGTSMTKTIDGLEPETEYIVNVQTDGATWLGGKTFFTYYKIFLDPGEDAESEQAFVEVKNGVDIPDLEYFPVKEGYRFIGYFTLEQGDDSDIPVQYYYADGTSDIVWNWNDNITIFAHWQEIGTGFAWTYEKVQDEPFNLTADEWNDLCDFVNSKRSGAYPFTVAVKDYPFTAAMYNEMVEAIGEGTEVEKGDPITADLMNELVTNANNM